MAALVVTLAGCGASETSSTTEPSSPDTATSDTATSDTATSDTATSDTATAETAVTEGSPTMTADDVAPAALRAYADQFEVDESGLEHGEPIELTPSGCALIPVWSADLLDDVAVGVVVPADGAAIVGGTDEALAAAARRCFTDRGLIPDASVAAPFVLQVGFVSAPRIALDDVAGPRLLEAVGVEWAPPAVTETTDGFTIELYAENPDTGSLSRVTAVVDADGATTTSESL